MTPAEKAAGDPKRPCRWLRFSLRTLLIAVTILCVWLGIVVERARKQREVVEWVNRLNKAFSGHGELSVCYDWQYDDKDDPISNAKPWWPQWMRNAIGDDYFQTVVRVDYEKEVIYGNTSDELAREINSHALKDIQPLANLPRLRALYLIGADISDWSPISELTSLRRLCLAETPITDLSPLAKLKELEFLDIRYAATGDFSLLERLPQLRQVYLPEKFDSEQLKKLEQARPECSFAPAHW